MADRQKYTVHRAMQGDDKAYERGDTRELSAADAAPLLASGAISLPGKEPVRRGAGVEHTFGARKNEDSGFTSALTGRTAPSVQIERVAAPGKARKA